jgi:UBX domain-containing protein 6
LILNKVVIDNNPLIQKIYFRSEILGAGVRYPKEDIENKIEQSLINQLDQEPILVSVSLLFTANYKNQEKLNKCVEILNKFADNIINKPDEEKYRKIRCENPIFKEKVHMCKYSDLVLKKSGFVARSLKKQPTESLNQSVEIIEDNKEDEYEAYFIYEEKNLEKLESLKLALSLGEPIVPELDRDLKCFRITEHSNLTDFQLDEDFYNISVEELRREQKLRNEALEKTGMLRTKAMRERDEQLELRRYNYCLIRVKFPNNFIIQGTFKSNETYQDLYNFVQECLETDAIPFELFSPLLNKKSLTNNDLSLAELRLAPASVLNFKWSDTVDQNQARNISKNYIRNDLLQNSFSFK